jgi:hypothetical protein
MDALVDRRGNVLPGCDPTTVSRQVRPRDAHLADFDGPPGAVFVPNPDGWPTDLTRRLRVLLHTLPLDGMRRGDAMRDAELRHYDSLALALRVLDLVIDRLGMEVEADRDVVVRMLRPLVLAMDESAGAAASPHRHETILDKILGGLRNDGEARRPFREEYTAIGGDGQAHRHALEFRLLYDAFHPSGRTVLRPSNEACNLYLRLLDLEIEDAQAAAEAVVESQLARGRFDEAVHSARQARIQSVRFRDKVLQILRDTRRDVDRVDWRRHVPLTLEESLTHLERRVGVERGILGAANERLEQLPEEEADGRAAVIQIADLTRDCLLRHAELHEHLIGARNIFLDAQARQSFAPKPARPLPDLFQDVLDPIARMHVAAANRVLEKGFPLLVGPHSVALPSLRSFVPWMLQPRRPRPPQEIPVEPTDPAELELEMQRYSPEIRAIAEEILRCMDGAVPLSELLLRARRADCDPAVLEVIALRALQAFATEERDAIRMAAERIPNASVRDPLLYGDDLLVSSTGAEG